MSNSRSIVNKLYELHRLLNVQKPDVVAIFETWLSPDIPDSLIVNGLNYTIFRKDRNSRGGGCCILIKKFNWLKISTVTVEQKYSDLEIFALDVTGNNISFSNMQIMYI